MNAHRIFQALAAFSAAIAVSIGAIGAHGPLAPTQPQLQALLATAILFHLVHSLALMQFGSWLERHPASRSITGWLFLAGMILFVGTLDWHVFTGVKVEGIWTPLGGSMLILAWLVWTTQILVAKTVRD